MAEKRIIWVRPKGLQTPSPGTKLRVVLEQNVDGRHLHNIGEAEVFEGGRALLRITLCFGGGPRGRGADGGGDVGRRLLGLEADSPTQGVGRRRGAIPPAHRPLVARPTNWDGPWPRSRFGGVYLPLGSRTRLGLVPHQDQEQHQTVGARPSSQERRWLLRSTVAVFVGVALAACSPSMAPNRSPTQGSTPSVPAQASGAATFQWPGETENSPDLSFASATDAVTFLSKHMDGDIALPTWVPSNVDLDTTASVLLATDGGIPSAQVKLATDEGGVWGIQYGVAGLDGCAPEHSVHVKVSGRPGRLRVSADPGGSERKWVELIWPATLKHPDGVFGLFGWLSPRAVLTMSRCPPCPLRQSASL
jgi:hypothetical protein